MAETIVIIRKTKKRPGKGNSRKIGREAKDLAHQRYNSEHRWVANKERRIAKEAKRQERLRARV